MTFEGFPPPTKNFFSLPNEMINVIAHIDNMAELKVIIYVIRHTWGYQEYGITKTISVDEFMHGRKRHDGTRIDEGTGLKSDRSVKDGLKAAIDHGYLVYEIDKSDLARIKKSYALKMIPSAEGYNLPLGIRQVVSTPLTGSIYPSEVQNLPLRQADTTPRTEKDTRERHLEKDTLERQERDGADAPTRAEIAQLGEVVDETLEEVKTASGKHKAVSSHSQGLSENDEDISLAATAHRMPAVKVTSQQKPGAAPLPVAAMPLHDRPGDASVQASGEPVSFPSQDGAALAAIPPASSGPRASGLKIVPARPQVVAKQRDLMPEAKPPTDKQINDRRAKEIWALIEKALETTFNTSHRKTDKNKRGMERLLEDQVTDEKIELALSRLDQWQIDNFNLERFHEWLPGKTGRRASNGKTPKVPDADLVEWQGRMMTVAEADALGFNGGFGAYK